MQSRTIQKLAHRRQEQEHVESRRASPTRTPSDGSDSDDDDLNPDGEGPGEGWSAGPANTKGNGGDVGELSGVEEGQYLKSKLWWTGQVLITLGEGGNFLSYAFAPASVVAPLGTVVSPVS